MKLIHPVNQKKPNKRKQAQAAKNKGKKPLAYLDMEVVEGWVSTSYTAAGYICSSTPGDSEGRSSEAEED